LKVIPKYDGLKLDVLALRCTAAGIQDAILSILFRRCEGKIGRASIEEGGSSGVVAARRCQVK